jgi:hypothetical protein
MRRVAVATSVTALLAIPAAAAATPAAAPYPPGAGSLFLSSTNPFAGRSLAFLGTGFTARERVSARLDTTVLRTFRADWLGLVAGRVIIPRNTAPGGHTFSLTGTSSGHSLSAAITVRRLPFRATAGAAPTTDNASSVANPAARRSGSRHTATATGALSTSGVSYPVQWRGRGNTPHR